MAGGLTKTARPADNRPQMISLRPSPLPPVLAKRGIAKNKLPKPIQPKEKTRFRNKPWAIAKLRLLGEKLVVGARRIFIPTLAVVGIQSFKFAPHPA